MQTKNQFKRVYYGLQIDLTCTQKLYFFNLYKILQKKVHTLEEPRKYLQIKISSFSLMKELYN